MKNLSDYIKEASNDSKEYVYAVKDEFGSIIQMFDTKEEADDKAKSFANEENVKTSVEKIEKKEGVKE